MNRAGISQLFSIRDIRNAAFGLLVVFGGIGLSAFTYYAHVIGNARLAGISAGISLVFVLLILIFVVPPLARNASKEASQLNLPFEFTVGGAIMLGLLMIVGFSAWNSGNNLLFLVLAFLAASLVVGFFAGSICLKKLDVRMRFPETIFAGQETPILVSIHNRKRFFPTFSVVAEVRGKERDRSIFYDDLQRILPKWIAARMAKAPTVSRTLCYFVYIGRRVTTEIRDSHMFEHRGRFLIKNFELSTKFPFGFFRHRRRLAARETELIVFPALADLDQIDSPLNAETGTRLSMKRGFGQELILMRDYKPNDEMRHIDWKATARTRQLIVREFADEEQQRIEILFDRRIVASDQSTLTLREKMSAEGTESGLVISEAFEKGVSLASALAAKYCGEQCEVAFITQGVEKIEFGTGPSQLNIILRQLAVIEPLVIPDKTGQSLPDRDVANDAGVQRVSIISRDFVTPNQSNGDTNSTVLTF